MKKVLLASAIASLFVGAASAQVSIRGGGQTATPTKNTTFTIDVKGLRDASGNYYSGGGSGASNAGPAGAAGNTASTVNGSYVIGLVGDGARYDASSLSFNPTSWTLSGSLVFTASTLRVDADALSRTASQVTTMTTGNAGFIGAKVNDLAAATVAFNDHGYHVLRPFWDSAATGTPSATYAAGVRSAYEALEAEVVRSSPIVASARSMTGATFSLTETALTVSAMGAQSVRQQVLTVGANSIVASDGNASVVSGAGANLLSTTEVVLSVNNP